MSMDNEAQEQHPNVPQEVMEKAVKHVKFLRAVNDGLSATVDQQRLTADILSDLVVDQQHLLEELTCRVDTLEIPQEMETVMVLKAKDSGDTSPIPVEDHE